MVAPGRGVAPRPDELPPPRLSPSRPRPPPARTNHRHPTARQSHHNPPDTAVPSRQSTTTRPLTSAAAPQNPLPQSNLIWSPPRKGLPCQPTFLRSVEEPFLRPGHKQQEAARAGAVRAGPAALRGHRAAARSGLDGAEHAATLVPTGQQIPPTSKHERPPAPSPLQNRLPPPPHDHPTQQSGCPAPRSPKHQPSPTQEPKVFWFFFQKRTASCPRLRKPHPSPPKLSQPRPDKPQGNQNRKPTQKSRPTPPGPPPVQPTPNTPQA